jgi:hypothetical protein
MLTGGTESHGVGRPSLLLWRLTERAVAKGGRVRRSRPGQPPPGRHQLILFPQAPHSAQQATEGATGRGGMTTAAPPSPRPGQQPPAVSPVRREERGQQHPLVRSGSRKLASGGDAGVRGEPPAAAGKVGPAKAAASQSPTTTAGDHHARRNHLALEVPSPLLL